jgi:hypothetical protein
MRLGRSVGLTVVGVRGFKLNPALMAYVTDEPPRRSARRRGSRRERRVSKRLETETIDRIVAEYVAGATAAEVGRRYSLGRNTVLDLVRQAGVHGIHGSVPLKLLM